VRDAMLKTDVGRKMLQEYSLESAIESWAAITGGDVAKGFISLQDHSAYYQDMCESCSNEEMDDLCATIMQAAGEAGHHIKARKDLMAELHKIASAMDSDHDSKITLHEFLEVEDIVNEIRGNEEPHASSMKRWAALTRNSPGLETLSEAEYTGYYLDLSKNLSDAQIEDLTKQLHAGLETAKARMEDRKQRLAERKAKLAELFESYTYLSDRGLSLFECQELADYVIPESMSNRQVDEIVKQQFKKMDVDGDGFVDLDEFLTFYVPWLDREGELDDAFIAGMAGYIKARDARVERRSAEMRVIFNGFDLDMDGQLDAEEVTHLGKILHRGKMEWTEEQSRMLLSEMDPNGNGFVTDKEFLLFYEPVYHVPEKRFEIGMERFRKTVAAVRTERLQRTASRLQSSKPVPEARTELVRKNTGIM